MKSKLEYPYNLLLDAFGEDSIPLDKPLPEETLRGLEYAVSLLPEQRRTALELRYKENLPMAEVAAGLGLSVSRARQILLQYRTGSLYLLRSPEMVQFIENGPPNEDKTGVPAVPLSEIGLPIRAYHRLTRDGYWTVADIAFLSETEIGKLSDFGAKSVARVAIALERLGIEGTVWSRLKKKHEEEEKQRTESLKEAFYSRVGTDKVGGAPLAAENAISPGYQNVTVPAEANAQEKSSKGLIATALSERYGVSTNAAHEYLEQFFIQKDYYPALPLSVHEECILRLSVGCNLSRSEAREEIAILEAQGIKDTRKLPKEFWTIYLGELNQTHDFPVQYILALTKLIRKKSLDIEECCKVAVWASVCGYAESEVLDNYDAMRAAMQIDMASARHRNTYEDNVERIWELSEKEYYRGEHHGLYA